MANISSPLVRGLLFLGLAGAGIVAVALALNEMSPVVAAIRAQEPLVVWLPRAAAGFPIGIALLILAALTAIPIGSGGARSVYPDRNVRINRVGRALMAVAICLVVSVLTSPLTLAALAPALESRGYRLCPARDGERPARYRWARSEGEDLDAACKAGNSATPGSP